VLRIMFISACVLIVAATTYVLGALLNYVVGWPCAGWQKLVAGMGILLFANIPLILYYAPRARCFREMIDPLTFNPFHPIVFESILVFFGVAFAAREVARVIRRSKDNRCEATDSV
jgi:hypothetical protein